MHPLATYSEWAVSVRESGDTVRPKQPFGARRRQFTRPHLQLHLEPPPPAHALVDHQLDARGRQHAGRRKRHGKAQRLAGRLQACVYGRDAQRLLQEGPVLVGSSAQAQARGGAGGKRRSVGRSVSGQLPRCRIRREAREPPKAAADGRVLRMLCCMHACMHACKHASAGCRMVGVAAQPAAALNAARVIPAGGPLAPPRPRCLTCALLAAPPRG